MTKKKYLKTDLIYVEGKLNISLPFLLKRFPLSYDLVSITYKESSYTLEELNQEELDKLVAKVTKQHSQEYYGNLILSHKIRKTIINNPLLGARFRELSRELEKEYLET